MFTGLEEGSTVMPTSRQLFEPLQPLSADWYLLGIKLDYSTDELNVIESNHRKVEHCMRDLLSRWQQKYPNKGWSDIVGALREMDRNDIGDELERQHLPPSPGVLLLYSVGRTLYQVYIMVCNTVS